MCQLILALYASPPSDSRAMCGIERTLSREAATPHTEYNQGKVEGHKRKIQEILGTLTAPSSWPDENPGAGEFIPHLEPVGLDHSAMAAVPESGATFATLLQILYRILTASASPTSTPQPANVWSNAHSIYMNFPP